MNVLIVDDDFGARGGMALTIREAHPAACVHEACSVAEAIDLLSQHPTMDLVLLDLNIEDSRGIATLKRLKQWCEHNDCNPRIVVVSGAADYDDTLVPEAIENCATGFIVKGTSVEVFRSAIDLTLAGAIYIPERYLRSRRRKTAAAGGDDDVTFTPREKQVAALLIQGLTYKQIARRLSEPDRTMSDNTVRVHVQRIAWKLRVNEDAGDGLAAKAAVITAFADQRLRFSVEGSR